MNRKKLYISYDFYDGLKCANKNSYAMIRHKMLSTYTVSGKIVYDILGI